MDFFEITEVDITNKSAVDTSQWQRCFFDLEGSLSASQGNILQMAVITTDWNFNITGVYNSYYHALKPISAEEYNVHRIDVDMAKRLGRGPFPEQVYRSPLVTTKPTMFISYTTFDINRVYEELGGRENTTINFGKHVSSLAHQLSDGLNCYYDAFTLGRKKGEKVVSELGEDVFQDIYWEMRKFGEFKMGSNHDALFDSAMILALCRRIANVGY